MMKRIREHETHRRALLALLAGCFSLVLPACVGSVNQDPGRFSGVGPAAENPVRTETKEDMKILFIGNSYSFGVPAALKKLAAEHGEKIEIGRATHGGWTLEQHASHEKTLKKLRSKEWDVVVIQEQSQRPAMSEEKRREMMEPAIRFFVDHARAVGAEPVLYQTWGRRDGLEWVENDDFLRMNARIRKGYQEAADHAGGVRIVRAGDAWEKEFLEGRGQSLFQEDGSHPSELGDQVTAKVFFATLFLGS